MVHGNASNAQRGREAPEAQWRSSRHSQPHAQCLHHAQQGVQRRIAIVAERPVEGLAADPASRMARPQLSKQKIH